MLFFIQAVAAPAPKSPIVLIGNFLSTAPNGVAFVVNDSAAFVMDPGGKYFAGTAAPDDSYHHTEFMVSAAKVVFDWGRVGHSIVGRLSADQPVEVPFRLWSGWPGFASTFVPAADGVSGTAEVGGREVRWSLHCSKGFSGATSDHATISVSPDQAVSFTAGIEPVSLTSADGVLDKAAARYEKRRPTSTGDWGNFVGAIADNLNNSRLYSSDNNMLAISVSRGWAKDVNNAPYFCWDSFFNGALSCLDDPKTARNTVRAILSCQSADGLVPNYGHWIQGDGSRNSDDRSQPPVGSMCVWKMHQRWPDRAFLEEVYPKLLKWHRWWPTARDAKHDGLLEWGSSKAGRQGALWETGWDDTVHFNGAEMVGDTLNAYAVDLSSLWAMDAEYLATIADELGKKDDAAALRKERERTLQLINEKLWNPEKGMYCSRLWDGTFLTEFTPMNFYPLIAGAASPERAAQVMANLTDPKTFWGQWRLPTVGYDNPVWPQQDYWKGKVWAPVNFLVMQGLQRYATPAQLADYGAKSVELFMRNWSAKNVCGENYLSSTGEQSSDPHYTWGALLCLVGIESIVWQSPDGIIHLNGAQTATMEIDNLPIGGRLYSLRTKPGLAELLFHGKAILVAMGDSIATVRSSAIH